MGLEDFEKELAANRSETSGRKRHRSRSKERRRDKDDHRRHRHHRDSRDKDDKDEERHRHSRRHRHRHEHDRDVEVEDQSHQRKRRRSNSPSREHDKHAGRARVDDDEDEWVQKEAMTAPPSEAILDERDTQLTNTSLKRDDWMAAPSSLNIDYVQKSKSRKSPPSQFVPAKEQHERKIHKHEIEQLMKDLEDDGEDADDTETQALVIDEPAQHQVSHTFGDLGSQWRMTKLRSVYRKAEETKLPLDQVAQETYGDLRDFDDAREEERELDRRSMYGKDYVGLEKPSGDLFHERKQKAGLRHQSPSIAHGEKQAEQPSVAPNAQIMHELPPPARTVPLDQTALNKLKAQMMKAKLRNAPNAAQLEAEYELASTANAANTVQSDVIVLNSVENRMLAGGREGEVTRIKNKRGRERGHVVENEDMSIEDMVRQEKRSRGQFGGEGRAFAERIAKDGKFDDNLDYMDENAAKLAKNMAKSDINLRNTAIGEFQKMQKILDSCPLCHHEDTNTPPAAPIVSLATRVYMALPTEPEVATGGAVIVPTQHHLNLLECDDDEWEEIRNFMKSLTRMYHQRDKGVIFYENAAHMHSRRGHAALFAVPVPFHLADNAPAYFKEAVLSADEEWSQHKKVIDTLAKSQQPGFGKQAFRKSLVKEMPYFHVWFTMDGGLGHVIEDERRWPKGDLFAREIIGGMLGKGPEVVKKQGRWTRQDPRVEGFQKRWKPFDWTRVLWDNAQ
ncbi:CwfJ C-terminus 1-domain-containing protein-like protein [Delphinella strobiligena]|nr:CwfJ C-terminus 1-domain-containing protein-like protein [Delphinella strobiligena]